ncbi:hypothetical protein AMECASPLE_030621 [Ameca splendens]|uniref:Uncharacterized protein n=1 Tax=Ameca splendens TaxID=208324 RepID=A0ABV0XVD8_9TELE
MLCQLLLMSVRMSVNQSTGYTPHELQTGRVFPGPAQHISGQTGESAQLSSNTFFNELQTLAAEFSRGPEGKRGSPVVPGVNWVSLKVIIKPGTQIHSPVPSPGKNIFV